jgi:hypothetical protein
MRERYILSLVGPLETGAKSTVKIRGVMMPSVRLRGVRARITDKNLAEKVQLIRALVGNEYKITIERNNISVEGNLQDSELRKKIVKILAS